MEPEEIVSKVVKEEPKKQTPTGKNAEPTAQPTDGGTAKILKSLPTPKIQEYKIGNKDFAGHVISDILAFGNEFVIYEIETTDINKKINIFIDGYDDISEKKIIDDYCEVKPNFIVARGLLYKSTNLGIMKNRVATALATALHGDPAKGNALFDELIKNIIEEYKLANRSRMLYITPGYILLTLLIVAFGLNSYYGWTQNIKELQEIYEWAIYVFAAVIGGVFSLTLNLPKIKFDTEISAMMFFTYGVERITISILAGIICVCGIKAKLILSGIADGPNSFWALFFIVVIAAFSEKMIPNILGKISDKGK